MLGEFRLIYNFASRASFNMAVDEAIFIALQDKESYPTLRFYQWEKPTISIGYFQKSRNEFDFKKIKEKNVDFIRRPTGGRAVLHWQEITFCLVIPSQNRGLWDIFKTVHESIGVGLKKIGINTKLSPVSLGKKFRTASCFASPSRYELTLNGKKIVGTAQKKVKDSILIHGAIPLFSNYSDLFECMVFCDNKTRLESLEQSLNKMTSLFSETKRAYTFNEVTKAIVSGLEENWKCSFEKSEFSRKELDMISRLENEKYKNKLWIYKY